MGPCEECKYFILGTCDEGERGCEASYFESFYEDEEEDC